MFARFFFLANIFLFMTSTHRTVLLLYFHFPCWDLNFLNQANSNTGIPQLYTLSIGNCLFSSTDKSSSNSFLSKKYCHVVSIVNDIPDCLSLQESVHEMFG